MVQIVHFALVLPPVSCGNTRNLPGTEKENNKKTKSLVTQSTWKMTWRPNLSTLLRYLVFYVFFEFGILYNFCILWLKSMFWGIVDNVFFHPSYVIHELSDKYILEVNFFLIWFLCHCFGLPHLEQTCLMLFEGYHVVVPLILRRRIRLCIALQEQALALWQHLRLRLKGNEQPADWPWKQTAGGAAVWHHHQLLWVGLLHCIKEKIIQNKQQYLQSEWHQCGPTGKRCSWHHGWPYKYSGPCGTRTMDTEPVLVRFLPHPRSMNDIIETINVKV